MRLDLGAEKIGNNWWGRVKEHRECLSVAANNINDEMRKRIRMRIGKMLMKVINNPSWRALCQPDCHNYGKDMQH